MKVGIIGAMQVEVETLQAKLTDKKTTNINQFTFYEGTISGTKVVVVLSGIGKVSATVGTTLLIEHYNPDIIINTAPFFTADESLVAIAKEVSEQHHQEVHCGLVVSGDSFINDPNRLQTIQGYFPKALAVEMEAAAISQVCYLFDIPFVVLRAISDKAGEGTTESYETFVEKAGKLSASMNIDFIKKITKNEQLWKK